MPGEALRLLLVTGMSGAGKSTALRALEDVGYYCVDNLPLPLVAQFVELLQQTGRTRAALVIDVREGEFLLGFRDTLALLRRAGHSPEVLFLDAADDVLLRRFSETRRRHPLIGDDLRGGIEHERQVLLPLREEAQAVVDTSHLTVHQLKGVIQERYGRSPESLALTLLSFGFKHGLPAEADIVLDVRFLPNPYFVEHLSAASGLEEPVARYVLEHPEAAVFLEKISDFLDFYLPRAQREGKAYLTLAIGCTGGRHRSVAVVVELAHRLESTYQVTVRHRDLERGKVFI
ncbi:MAG: RNase adapter RapZ [Myxococcota bacterium]|nr:RNase adapter RapZ [Myxococcota bacterium]